MAITFVGIAIIMSAIDIVLLSVKNKGMKVTEKVKFFLLANAFYAFVFIVLYLAYRGGVTIVSLF